MPLHLDTQVSLLQAMFGFGKIRHMSVTKVRVCRVEYFFIVYCFKIVQEF